MRCNRELAGVAIRIWSVVVLGAAGCAAVRADESAQIPQRGVTPERYPDDDAVVLRHDRKWAQLADGAIRFEEHKWTQFLTRRAFREASDPGVVYREGLETVEILAARAHLPDGSTVDVPAYGINDVSPRDVANYPAWADWRERVVSFSGVQIGAVLELHYVRTSEPGAKRRLEADLRLVGRDPVMDSSVEVSLPGGSTLRYRADNLPEAERAPKTSQADGASRWSWRFGELNYCGDESGATGWQERCPRLRFTSCSDMDAFVGGLIEPMARGAEPNEGIGVFATEHGGKELDNRSRVREIASAFGERFDSVGSRRAWAAPGCRAAAEVFKSNYGSDPEAAALMAAMLRAQGMDARPMIAVDDEIFDENVPTESAVAGFVVAVRDGEDEFWVDPAHGIVREVGAWARRSVWGLDGQGGSARFALNGAGEKVDNRIVVRADLKVDEKGETTGEIKLRLGGVFFSPDGVRDDAGRKKEVQKILGGILEGFEIVAVQSAEGSTSAFRATATIRSIEPLAKLAERFLLTLSDKPSYANSVHLPLSHSERSGQVEIASPFVEKVDVAIEFPEEWVVGAAPISVSQTSGGWGSIEQTVMVEPGELNFSRRIALDSVRIDAGDFGVIRDALNTLRSDGARRILIGAGSE